MKTNNSPLNILIVEDELSFALELEMLVQKIGYNVIGTADSSGRALELIFSHLPDFILMDISIQGDLSGTEIGQKIKHLQIPILFITSFGNENHYQEAQKSNMVGFLVKPLDKYSLRTAIDLAIKSTATSPQLDQTEMSEKQEMENPFVVERNFFFKKRGIYHKVLLADILYIKSDKNYCEVYTASGQNFISRITLSKMEEALPKGYFIRIHRQYLIKSNKIESINLQDNLIKIKEYNLPLSRKYRDDLERMMYKIK